VDFLRDASEAGAKFLLTSRRDERQWLVDLPARVTMPPMPFRERFQLANALAGKRHRSIPDIDDWRPLLEFTQGNPLTITVVVGEALRANLHSASEIERFVAKLRTGEAKLHDEAKEGRDRSLTASLSYGLEHAFGPDERKLLALVGMFQGVVNAGAFMALAQELTPTEGMHEVTVEHVTRLFDTASQLGIMEKISEVVYEIHPAVPWFFHRTFEAAFQGRERECVEIFCTYMGNFAAVLSDRYQDTGATAALFGEESNFLHAFELAIQWKLWEQASRALHAIEDLYGIQGRFLEWKRLVERLERVIFDSATGKPVEGAEDAWPRTAEHLMRIAKRERRFEDAVRYGVIPLEHYRKKAVPYISGQQPPDEGREEIHNLSVMLDSLGALKAELGSPECLGDLEESLRLAEMIGHDAQAAMACHNLGFAYREIPSIRDYRRAAEWCSKALEKTSEKDHTFRGRALASAGEAYLFLSLGLSGPEHLQEKADSLQAAVNALLAARRELPKFAVADRAEVSGNLGGIFLQAGKPKEAEILLRESLELAQRAQSVRFEWMSLFNLGSLLYELGRYPEALVYAKAANDTLQSWGSEGYQKQVQALELMQSIQAKLNG
jgi:tetratricopeptide (TPR) repeat protein